MVGLLSRLNYARLDRRGRRWLDRAAARAPLWLDLGDYADRDVAIIGPARGVADEIAQQPLGTDTVIVRMNRSALLALRDPGAHGGPETHLLFHMLKIDGDRGTGPIDRVALRDAGVRHIVYPHALPRKIKTRVLQMSARFGDGLSPDLRLPPLAVYADLDTDCAPFTPTTGATAIATMLAARPARLSIYGFSFFQTAYAPGYNDSITDATAARWARGSDIHDPVGEARVVAARLRRFADAGGTLRLGAGVADALARSG